MYPLCWSFWCPSRCSGTITRTSPNGGGSGLSLKPLNATIGRALAPLLPNQTHQRRMFRTFPVDMMAPNNNRGMTYQTDEKHFTIFPEYFFWVFKLSFNCYNNCFLLHVFTSNLPNIFITPRPRLAPYQLGAVSVAKMSISKLSYCTIKL